MKKILICMLLVALAGCSNNAKESTASPYPESTSTETASELTHVKPAYHEQLMAQDFSAIAGEYVSSKGEKINIDNKGLQVGGDSESYSEVSYVEGYGYIMSIGSTKDEYGVLMTVYPIGVEVSGVPTDTTKVRIGYSNGEPINDEYIYTKNE